MLSKDQCRAFFKETRDALADVGTLKKILEEHRQGRCPTDALNRIQEGILTRINGDADAAMSSLKHIRRYYADDKAFMDEFYAHIRREEAAVGAIESLAKDAPTCAEEHLTRFAEQMKAASQAGSSHAESNPSATPSLHPPSKEQMM